ncbi:MAG TPA: cbb3-type cytochrome c oxidase subunit I [Anaerolineales bacterium]|nr:cbb3-type cytochrome c oxidase subunit I [Anaerolineales bacterium]
MARIGWQEKWTLRYAVAGLVWLAINGFEGALMRVNLFDTQALHGLETFMNILRPVGYEPTTAQVFYSMMTAHPICGVYGFAYMSVMGAFYFLVPFLLKKDIRYPRLIPINFWLQTIGVFIAWGAGFFLMFNSLYTLYWPLPVAFDRVPLVGSIVFAVGAAVIMVNILLFSFNIFSTVAHKSHPGSYGLGDLLRSTLGIHRLQRWLGRKPSGHPEPQPEPAELPVFIVSVTRGSVDTVINAVVLLTAGALILVYGLATMLNSPLNPSAVSPLLYKNWFWWGLDMVADGNVLIYSAGVWYLLIPLLVGRKLFGESVVRTVILVDLLVSLGVWSHHLLADQPQPVVMRLLSGQIITWGEFFTMGLTIFASLMTIWLARPVKLNPPLKFVLASIFGFLLGGAAGLVQANLGLNVVLHNTQWVISTHAHTMLLNGLSMLIFAVIYALLPMLTKLEFRSKVLVDVHLWAWLLGSLTMAYSMGWAGVLGMLRRMLYETPNIYQPQSAVALGGALLLAVGFVAFLVNILITLGWTNLIELLKPGRRLPAAAEAAA